MSLLYSRTTLGPLALRRESGLSDMSGGHSIRLIVGFAILFAGGGVLGASVQRGAELYESRCGECHSESVHGRKKRVATDFDEVRRWVSRWNENLKLRWGDDEIDDVTVYLNKTYYRYACPPQVCKVVSLAPSGTKLSALR
jgi:hypothetical protein